MDQTILELNDGWKFHYGDVPEAWYKGYDDDSWENIFLPHDWSVHMPFCRDYSSGTGYLAGGIGWYRLHFSLPEEFRGRHIQIVFDGIYKNSRIWCNSYHLGKRPYGYSEISYDITDFVNFGETDNEISVQVTRTDLADSRWFTGCGIYRGVWLIAEENIHPSLHGIRFCTEDVRCEEGREGSSCIAWIKIDAEFVNEQNCDCCFNVYFHLVDASGMEAALCETFVNASAGGKEKITLECTVKDAHPWSVNDPYLYTLVTEISTWNYERWIAQKEKVGIRTIRFDPDEGFFLNGENTKIKGVCVHDDGGALGTAMYKEVWLRRLLKLKDAGCNAIRTSHNPHMPQLYDLCDELGFLMMDEAFDEWENPKNKWSTGHNVYPPKHQGYAEDFPQWYEADLTAMIKRDWNHPSVILWSIGNEIDYPNDPYCHPYFASMTGNNDADKPEAERRYQPDRPNAKRLSVLAARLAKIVKKLDDSRPVTLAAAFPELSSRIGFFDELEVVGYNYKEDLYEADHARFPQKSFLGSENSHSYKAWKALRDHPYISGQFLWTGIDYLGEARGWPVHGSGAGILDLAGYEKPDFYRRKAWWSDEPYISLLSAPDDGVENDWKPFYASWNYKDKEQVKVYCYVSEKYNPAIAENKNFCGCGPVLFLNDKTMGTGEWNENTGCFEWSVTFEPGILKASFPHVSDGKSLSCQIETAGRASHFAAKLWRAPEWYSKDAAFRVAQVEVTLLDDEDRVVQDDDLMIEADVKGGTLLGMENGDISDCTSYAEPMRKTYLGRLIIYVRPDGTEPAGLTVSCDELKQSVTLTDVTA